MKHHLEAMLEQRWVIERCTPRKALYAPEQGCLLRYELLLRGTNGTGTRDALLGGRLFSDPAAAAAFVRDRLAPLAEQARGRDEVAPFERPVAGIDALGLAAYAFPIDAELPTLVGATDSERMLALLQGALGEAFDDMEIHDCRVQLVHYPRHRRCLLRYEVDGRHSRSGGLVTRAVYGKLGGSGWALAETALNALRECELTEGGRRIGIPCPLGVVPELDLALVEAIPGRPKIPELVRARVADGARGDLEQAIDTCARIAAALHTSGLALGPMRTFDQECRALDADVDALRRLAPALAARVDAWAGELAARAADLEAMPIGLSHGDFTPAQVVFTRDRAGIVDFDTVCRAEPALDLGRFGAYLRLACRKADAGRPSSADLGADLCRRFLACYAAQVGIAAVDLPELRARADVYEALTLARTAVRSWCQLKPARTAAVIALLEERMARPAVTAS
jgi:aminoglycoside phosphotransferase (APT) family kinase protein